MRALRPRAPGALAAILAASIAMSGAADTAGAPGEAAAPGRIPRALGELGLREKVGQLVIAGFEGEDVEGQAEILVRDYKVAGFILYRRNFGSDPAKLAELAARLQALREPGSPPLLLCIDEEGGTVSRILDSGRSFPSAAWLGRGDPDQCYAVARRVGAALRGAGIRVNFAPVLDIHHRERSDAFSSRAFSSSASEVELYGRRFAEGLLAEGILPVVKHYPGQGLLVEDTHNEGGKVMRSQEWMEQNDSLPFESILRSLPVGVMMNHASYPLIDPSGLPASRGACFMRDRLRGELGFEGLVFVDEITMRAFAPDGELGKAAVQAVANGADILVAGHSFEAQRLVLESLYRAAERGAISARRLDESAGRVLDARRRIEPGAPTR